MEIDVHLFGKPEWEIDLDKASAEDIKDLGLVLKERLKRASVIIDKLEKSGWKRSAGLYDIFLHKDISMEDTKNELELLEIGEKDVSLFDDGIDNGDTYN